MSAKGRYAFAAIVGSPAFRQRAATYDAHHASQNGGGLPMQVSPPHT
jgi:hypothetical protein